MKHLTGVRALGLLVLFWGISLFAHQAPDPLVSIKKSYADTSAAIELGRKGEGGGLYCNEVQVNSRGLSWRAVGNYSKKIALWYSDQPEFAAFENKSGESVLVKVEVKTAAAVRSEYEEYLFQDGALVFYYRRSQEGAEPQEEERCYIQDKTLLGYIKGSQTADEKKDLSPILKQAAAYQRLFLAMFH